MPLSLARLTTIPVFYCDKMAADNQSFSPSAGKPTAVVDSWTALGLDLSVQAPAPVSRDELARAHDPAYVEGILECRINNGFSNKSAAVAASLPFANGSMLAAAREAIRNGQVAVAPCSGFHHARYAESAGFCTFNGLMVAALALHGSSEARRVGTLDFDQPYEDIR